MHMMFRRIQNKLGNVRIRCSFGQNPDQAALMSFFIHVEHLDTGVKLETNMQVDRHEWGRPWVLRQRVGLIERQILAFWDKGVKAKKRAGNLHGAYDSVYGGMVNDA